jgi:transposase
MSYNKKRRIQAVKYGENHTQAETAEGFGVSVSAVKEWQKMMRETGDLGNKPQKRRGQKIKEEALRADEEKYPDDFNSERAVGFGRTGEAKRLALKRHKVTRKKRQ